MKLRQYGPVTYNAEIRYFGSMTVTFDFLEAGSIQITKAGGYRPISVCRPGEMPIQSCGQSVSAPRGKAGARLNAHTELRTRRQRSAQEAIYRNRPIENKHSTDVESPPPPPLVCMNIHPEGSWVRYRCECLSSMTLLQGRGRSARGALPEQRRPGSRLLRGRADHGGGRGLHSSTIRLNVSAFCGTGVHLGVV